jgi:hypothetical protein
MALPNSEVAGHPGARRRAQVRPVNRHPGIGGLGSRCVGRGTEDTARRDRGRRRNRRSQLNTRGIDLIPGGRAVSVSRISGCVQSYRPDIRRRRRPIELERRSPRGAVARYAESGDKDVRNLALALLKHFERFFAFLRNEGVEPTNNAAERALRCAVQWRKTSFGSRSSKGEVAVARLLTTTRTAACRIESRSVTPAQPSGHTDVLSPCLPC